MVWNGQHGKTIFFQNEMPYDVPDQASWNSAPGVNGFAAYKVGTNVTTHEGWGLGAYCFFNTNPAVSALHAFEVPTAPGVLFHETTPSGTVPVNVVSFP